MNLLGLKCVHGNFIFYLIFNNTKRKFHLAAEEMDEADNELREVICKLWPNLAKKNY